MSQQNTPQTEFLSKMVKSNNFRVVYSEGVWGGISPQGLFNVSFFNERYPIPRVVKTTLAEISPGRSKAVSVEPFEAEDGTVREIEVEVIMTIEEAEAVANWMLQNIKNYREFINDGSQG